MKRHGDILLVRREGGIPESEKRRDDTILAVGEATGHHHRLVGQAVVYGKLDNPVQFVEIVDPAELVHEEHKTINLEPGRYTVFKQREFDYTKLMEEKAARDRINERNVID
jgi:hypothetical protein